MKKLIRRLLFGPVNLIKFRKVPSSQSRKILMDARSGLDISISDSAKLTLSSPCFFNRGPCYMIVREKGELTIGKNVFFNTNCQIACHEKIEIGDDTLFGPNVCVFDHDHLYEHGKIDTQHFKTRPIKIGKNAWIGAGSIILKGAEIGDNAIIGAGSVVNTKVPANSVFTQKRTDNIREF